jgi:hypothetical protein
MYKEFIYVLTVALFVVVNARAVLAEPQINPAKYERLVNEAKANSKEMIESSEGHFVCAGLGLVNTYSGMEGATYFFKDDSREFVCMRAMGNCLATNLTDDCSEICPPPKWIENGCKAKYLRYVNTSTKKSSETN